METTTNDYAIKVLEEYIYDYDGQILGTKTEGDFNEIYSKRQLLIDILNKIKS